MAELVVAVLVFLGTHLLPSITGWRRQMVLRLGAWPWRLVYSIVSLATIFWMVHAYGGADFVPLWHVSALQWLPLAVMPVISLLFVCALTNANPSLMAGERHLRGDEGQVRDVAFGIQRVTRHPGLWAFGGWAVLHMLANGDLASQLLFGSIAVLSFGGMVTLDRRLRDHEDPDMAAKYQAWQRATSIIPFAALAAGRQPWRPSEIGWWRLGGALAVWIALVGIHPLLFGVMAHPV